MVILIVLEIKKIATATRKAAPTVPHKFPFLALFTSCSYCWIQRTKRLDFLNFVRVYCRGKVFLSFRVDVVPGLGKKRCSDVRARRYCYHQFVVNVVTWNELAKATSRANTVQREPDILVHTRIPTWYASVANISNTSQLELV